MAKDKGLYFTCPACAERFSQIEEMDTDIFADKDYTALCCGARIRIAVLTTEGVVALMAMDPPILPPSKGLRA